jgi:hypothetical protein
MRHMAGGGITDMRNRRVARLVRGVPQGIFLVASIPDPLIGVSSGPKYESPCEPMREVATHSTASNTDLISIRVY